MQVKQPAWAAMPVLDVCALSDAVLAQLAAAYDTLCSKELQALSKLDVDPVRAQIDAILSAALNLPDLKPLRQLLAREPGLTGIGISHRLGQSALFPDKNLTADTEAQLHLI